MSKCFVLEPRYLAAIGMDRSRSADRSKSYNLENHFQQTLISSMAIQRTWATIEPDCYLRTRGWIAGREEPEEELSGLVGGR